MLRINRSVSASYSQTHFILPEYLMQEDERLDLDEAKDKLKQAGMTSDKMAALERHLAPAVNETVAKEVRTVLGFVSGVVESQTEQGVKTSTNNEDIELPEESGSVDGGDRVEVAQKDVPSAVFGGLLRKREVDEERGGDDSVAGKEEDGEGRLGALERIKRHKRGA